MCPNCTRGLVGGELCTICNGTGFWNPASVSVSEAATIMAYEPTPTPEAVTADTSVTVEAPSVEEATTEPVSVPDEVVADAPVEAPVEEAAPTVDAPVEDAPSGSAPKAPKKGKK